MKRTLTVIAVAVAAAAAGGAWYLHAKQPLRNGSLALAHLQAPVDVRYDERGVPHLYAQNQTDLYRALGYVHAQDRLFQMEMLRRLARGELAEVLGPKLVDTDRLFRTLRIRDHAAEYSARQDKQSQPWKVLEAYLDGVNQFQENNPAPLEFDLLGIPRRPFTPEDTLSIAGYMAYSFAAAFRTEPVLTYIRDELGSDYLRIFDLDWHPQGVLTPSGALGAGDWKDLGALARLSQQALEDAGLPQFEGSNAWVVAGSRTASGKPLLAGDPHIRFAAPAVWYEAQLSAPGFELYGHHQALNPFASLGHNRAFGWSLTMFQLSAKIGPAPWAVTYGPSTRRLVDFADPTHSLGINPVGQSGVPFDGHYDDQAEAYIEGHYLPQHYEENEVKANSKGVLVLEPKR